MADTSISLVDSMFYTPLLTYPSSPSLLLITVNHICSSDPLSYLNLLSEPELQFKTAYIDHLATLDAA